MYVGLKMLKEFPTATPDTLVVEADKIMNENRLWMLLVVEGKKLVGYVNKEDVREALPSRATSLDKHELNYLLSKLTIEKILRKDVPTAPPETEIEEAAELMYLDNLAGLAVVDTSNNLLGFINRSLMLEVLVDEMGLKQGGERIVFEVEDRTGVIYEVSKIIYDMGVSIISTGTFFHDSKRIVVFRVKTDDPTPIAKALHNVGYTLVGPETFEHEWRR
jgi:acetoin utilization protein AcuB